MDNFIQYIENTLAHVPDNGTLYHYKKRILDEMTQRANEITGAGMKDQTVLNDLIISEYPDLKADYEQYYKKEQKKKREKRFVKYNVIGSVLFILLLTVVYLSVSFLTKDWAHTWLIMEGGLSIWLAYLIFLGIKKICTLRRIFHPIARILLALNIMLLATFVFLCCLALFHLPHSWLVYIAAVILMFVADGIFAAATKQKLAIINYLIYIPAAAPMFYILLCVPGVMPWNPGWLLMPLSVVVDIVIIVAALIHNSKYIYKQEAEDAWNEN